MSAAPDHTGPGPPAAATGTSGPATAAQHGGAARRRPGRRPLLTRARLAQAAFDLVDAEGAAALTINRLARDLGVSPMTTYGYASSKAEIVRMLPDLLLGDLPSVNPDLPWPQALEEVFLAVYRRFVRHHHVLQAISDEPVFGRTQAGIIEGVLQCLDRAGFDPVEAFELQRALATYTMGFALFSVAEREGGVNRPRTSWAADLNPADFPRIARIADLLGEEVTESQYLSGLRRILRYR